jgi:hypothetical protein
MNIEKIKQIIDYLIYKANIHYHAAIEIDPNRIDGFYDCIILADKLQCELDNELIP